MKPSDKLLSKASFRFQPSIQEVGLTKFTPVAFRTAQDLGKAGFEVASVVDAIRAGDLSRLKREKGPDS